MEKQPNDTSSGAPWLFDRVRNILESARAGVARTVNTAQVMANWLIGREIVEEEQRGKRRADYGKQLVAQLSERLTAVYGKGWSVQNLFYMKQFYQSYPRLLPDGGMFHAAGGESPHAAILHAARGESATASSLSQDAWQPGELHAHLSWTHYRTLLRVGLKCYVLIDLKVGKLTHGDLGQIQFYVNYYDRERRTEGDNPTLGLILCSDKNDSVVKYTLGEQQERNIFTSRYQLYLPTEEELQRELNRELRYLSPAAPKPARKRTPKDEDHQP